MIDDASPTEQPLMRAAVLDAVGAPLRIATIARPEPAAGEALVRIMASGLNPLDAKIQAGAAPHARQVPPVVLGLDMAGVIVRAGAGVTGFRSGDEVYGLIGGVGGRQGSLAEYAAVDSRLLALKPRNLNWREAASLPLAAITAWEGLVDRAHVRAGWKVLVHGGAGGVGRLAIQIAKSVGAEVAATGSASSRKAIESMGAGFIDYNAETVAAYVARLTGGVGFDLVYDTVGGGALDASFAAIGRFGHVVSALGWGAHALGPLSFRAGTYSGVFTLLPLLTGEGGARHGEILREVAGLVEAGQITANIDYRTFNLDNVGEALLTLNAGVASGKLVIDISSAEALLSVTGSPAANRETTNVSNSGSAIIEQLSPLGFEVTLDRLTQAIERAGLTIFARIDHAEGARSAGLAMPPTVVLIYGHAKGGTPLMLAAPQAALDLPLRVLVREDADGRILVAFHPIAPMMSAAGVPDALASRLEPAQNLLIEEIQS